MTTPRDGRRSTPKRSFAVALSLLWSGVAGGQAWELVEAPTTTSLRGVSAPSEQVVWVSGARGAVARSVDAGRTFALMRVPGADSLDFRDIEAFDAMTATVLSIGNGSDSRIYRTTDGGTTWSLQFTNPDSAAFYDCFSFWSPQRGIAMSDPVGGRFRILRTADGGMTWTVLPPESSPVSLDGEAGFAASGGCVVTGPGGHAWIATGGGPQSRMLHSQDYGATWSVAPVSPIAAGAPPRGTFAVAAADGHYLAAVGGDYEQPTMDASNMALSQDGGMTWRAPTGRRPGGYRSGISFVPGTGGRMLVTVGTSGTDYSIDAGESWVAADTLPLNAAAFVSPRAGWAVGPRGRIVRWRAAVALTPIRIEKQDEQ